jgi:uncharacterized Zn finger protein (UPF0148 family)
MSREIKFCPNCDNILDITKNPQKKNNNEYIQQIEQTPTTISDVNSDINEDLDINTENINSTENIIKDLLIKIKDGKTVNETEILDYKLEQFVKNKFFIEQDKKTKSIIQSKLISLIEKIEDYINWYYTCNVCYYYKSIESGALIMTETNTESSNTYMNYDKLKNRKHNKMLGYTRNYICNNTKCVSHKDATKREAVMYRIGNNMQIWYTCRECESYWKGE